MALRIVFFGTPEFGVPSLEALLGSPHSVVGVVTQPDRPRDRGQKPSVGAVKARAQAAGLAVVQPQRLKDPAFLATLESLRPDLGVVAAYGKILTEAVLGTPRLGLVNVHASLLPRYRGAAPVHRAVIDGETETGVTIMRVVKALDAGPMLARVKRPIGPEETSEEVERALARLGADLLLSVVDSLATGSMEEMPQEEAAATYAPRLTKDDGLIDWTLAARRIHDLIRGLHPWPHAFTFAGGHRLVLLRSRVLPPAAEAPPGTVVEAGGDRLQVATSNGLLAVTELQPEGRRAMSAREFLAGHRLAVGTRFTSSP